MTSHDTLTRIQMRCFNLQSDAYIINQCTSHFYWNLNGSYGRICKWTRFPIRLGVNRLKMQLLITPFQCTLGPQKFNWVISGLMFTSDFSFINIWTVFPFTTVLPSVGPSCFSHSIHEAPKHWISFWTQPFANGFKRFDNGYFFFFFFWWGGKMTKSFIDVVEDSLRTGLGIPVKNKKTLSRTNTAPAE